MNKGFTLIEIIVVIGIITFILAFGAIIDLNVFKSDTFQTERATIVSTLERARSHAMANILESTYGVCYLSPNYVIFRGSICTATGNELIPANINIASNPGTTSPFPTVIFNQLAGTTTTASLVTIHIEDGIKKADITINHEGTINW